MNSLSKGMCVVVGVVTALWIGAQFFPEARHPDNGAPSRQQPGNDSAFTSLQQQLGALRNRLAQIEQSQSNWARLQARLTQLEDAQQHLRAEMSPALPQDPRLAPGEKSSDGAEEPETADHTRRQQLLSLLQAQFLRQAEDPSWSRQTEASLSQVVTGAAFDGSRLLTAACRTTVCQVEIGHESETAQEGFIKHFPFALPFDTEVFYQQIEDAAGTPYTVMYLARAGQRLPMSEQ
jgi:hypothetical protein